MLLLPCCCRMMQEAVAPRRGKERHTRDGCAVCAPAAVAQEEALLTLAVLSELGLSTVVASPQSFHLSQTDDVGRLLWWSGFNSREGGVAGGSVEPCTATSRKCSPFFGATLVR